MEWGFFVALVLAIPVILLPVALAWYLNAGRILAFIKKVKARLAREKAGTTPTNVK